MPRFLATAHAVQRFCERCRIATPDPAAYLASLAAAARVAAQQAGRDLLLDALLPGAGRVFLPVTPLSHDTWVIRTVLSPAQAGRNLARARTAARQAWRRRCGRPVED